MGKIDFERSAAVCGEYDVVVCGGGPSGFIAAIAAARNGARTAIVEQYGFFGGMATAGLVEPISVFSCKGERIIGGIPWEFIEKLRTVNGAWVEHPLQNVAFDPELYKLCAQRMVKDAAVDMFMHSVFLGCKKSDEKISHLFIANKSGISAIKARMIIDATGDADVAFDAGVPMQKVEEANRQPASFIFVLEGVDTESELLKCMHHNREGENMHCLPLRNKLNELAREHPEWPSYGGPWFCTILHPGCVAVNMTRIGTDPTNSKSFTEAECQLREDIYHWTEILRNNIPEFRNCRVCQTAVQIGFRDSRRIVGLHTISGEEYIRGEHYMDSIARGAHPIDIHTTDGSRQDIRFLDRAAYVPYRALISEGFDNLIMAGKTISADRFAFASLRVQATAMDIGQAAGTAAAICAQNNCKVQDLNIEQLQRTLISMGSCIE